MSYLYIFGTIFFTVLGQILIKWRMNNMPGLPDKGILELFSYFFKLLIDPYIFGGFVSAFAASIFWLAAMTKFEITVAYPFMSIAPALVFIVGVLFLGESFTIGKVVGLALIIIGVIVTVKL